jgi:putative hydrolase of the HAD superfamily
LITARDRGARCFVLSNTSFLHARMIFENEVLASIPELHILSYKVGLMKPDPRIWLKLLEYTGLDAGDCLYIDDVEAYCDAARGLGFGVFCYDRNTHFLSQILQDVLK